MILYFKECNLLRLMLKTNLISTWNARTANYTLLCKHKHECTTSAPLIEHKDTYVRTGTHTITCISSDECLFLCVHSLAQTPRDDAEMYLMVKQKQPSFTCELTKLTNSLHTKLMVSFRPVIAH